MAVTLRRFVVSAIALLLAGCGGRGIDDNRSRASAPDASASSGGQGGATTSTGGVTATGGSIVAGMPPFMPMPRVPDAATGPRDATAVACDYDASNPFAPARVDMKTLCSPAVGLDCTKTAGDLLRGYVCTLTQAPVFFTDMHSELREVGCGYETIRWSGGYGGPSYTFSLSTGGLVAASVSSDVNWGPCNASRYSAGEVVECVDTRLYLCVKTGVAGLDAGVSQCTPEQERELLALPERPDCDCSLPPGVDPCFAPTGCECWCTQIQSLKEQCPGVR